MEFLLELFFFSNPTQIDSRGLNYKLNYKLQWYFNIKKPEYSLKVRSQNEEWETWKKERKKDWLVGWFLSFKVLDQLHHTTDVNSKTPKQQSPLPAQHVVFFWSADRNVAILSSNHKSLLVAKPDCKASCNLITSSAAGMRHNFFFSFSYKLMT